MTDGEFKNILLPCYRRMYAVAYTILRNADDASDAVQDVISILWQQHKDLPVPDNPMAYCCRVARNNCIDHLRSNSKRYFDNINDANMLVSDSLADSVISYKTTSSRIAEILSIFKEKQRKILVLNIFSQLSNAEISKIMGESEENIRVILSRGRTKMKEYLNDER